MIKKKINKNFDLMNEYKNHLFVKGCSKSTFDKYYKNAQEYFNTLNSPYITKEHITNYLIYKFKYNYKPTTKNSMISSMNDIIKFAKSKNIFDKPNFKFESVNQSSSVPKSLTELEVKNILSDLEKKVVKCDNNYYEWINFRNYAIFIFIYATGLRVSEFLNFQLNHFEKENFIRVHQGKGPKDRIVPIARAAKDAVYKYIEKCPYNTSKNLWVNQSGTLLTRTGVYLITKKYNISPHILRHSYATHMYKNGMDLFVLKELLGHSDIDTTQIYLKTQNEQLKECVKKHHPINKQRI